ncbi:L,D-transpeptidase family protein [Hymenobacter armeniacus]|nr:L,D-transpeptidase family protein [Hymenobacter armeniacus]
MLRRLSCCGLLVLSVFQLFAQSCSAPGTALPPDSLVGKRPAAFWKEQLRFPRVRAAQAAIGPQLAARLREHALDPKRLEVFIRMLKSRAQVEVWARNQGSGPYELFEIYPLAATSGTLGPKRRAGDRQVPEGFYEIDRFNPKSDYYLSLGLNYPNAADRALGEPNPGGDIFIHGGEVTIGCMPITDAGIEEVYLLAVAARAAGQPVIPVHIFPFPLTEAELAKRRSSPHQAFWRSLMPGYAYFEQHHDVLRMEALAVAR